MIVNVPREAFYVWACHDCVVAHTTYYGAAPNASFRILPSDFTNAAGAVVRSNHNLNLTIVNNLFLSASGFNDMVIGLPTETTGLAMSHNLWFAQGMATTAGVYSDIAFAGEPTSLYASNPLLNGAPTNMRPSAGSPAQQLRQHIRPDLIVVASMHQRKSQMANMSDGFIALPSV